MPSDPQKKFLWDLNANAERDTRISYAFRSFAEFTSYFNESGQRADATTILSFRWSKDATLEITNDVQDAYRRADLLVLWCSQTNIAIRVTNADHDAAASFLSARLSWLRSAFARRGISA
jgi:hypothetical protein